MTAKNETTEATKAAFDSRFDAIKDSVKNVVDSGGERVQQIKEKIVDVKDTAMDRGAELLAKTTRLIKAHPMAAIGIAFGTGYFLMRLVRR